MNLRRLECFIAVADTGSLRAAARRLHVTPPSLSQQLKVLEAEIGGELLERLPRGTRLTPAGRAFLPEARAAVLAAQSSARSARAALDLETAQLEIATVFSLAVGLLPRAIQRLRRQHPGMAIRLFEYGHRDLLMEAVLGGVADVGVGPLPRDDRVSATLLGHESFVAIVGRDHPAYMAMAGITVESLADDEWVIFPEGHGLGDLARSICRRAGFVPRDAVFTDQADAAVRLAAAGLGVAIVPENIVPSSLHRFMVPLDPPVYRPLAVFTRGTWSPQAEAFRDALRSLDWLDVPDGAVIEN